MEFKIRKLDWYKRRSPVKEPEALSVKIPDFKKEENHPCDVFTLYDDGIERRLLGRVVRNSVTGVWAVNGLANGGFVVFAQLISE